MAKEKKKHHGPHTIITRRADDHTFSHHHLHEGDTEPRFAGTSAGMEDVHAHMDDHFGGGGEPAEEEAEENPAAAGE